MMHPNPTRVRALAQAAEQYPWFAGAVGDPDTPLLNLVACVPEGLRALDAVWVNRQADFLAYLTERAAWAATDPAGRLAALRRVLGDEEGFVAVETEAAAVAETCFDYLLTERLGHPALVLSLYLAVGYRLGWPLLAADSADRLRLLYPTAGQPLVLDPADPHGLRPTTPTTGAAATPRPVTERSLAHRLLNAQGAAFRRLGDAAGLKVVAQKRLLMEPQSPERLRDLGHACRDLAEAAEAVACWRTYLEEVPDAADRIMLLAAIAQLEGEDR